MPAQMSNELMANHGGGRGRRNQHANRGSQQRAELAEFAQIVRHHPAAQQGGSSGGSQGNSYVLDAPTPLVGRKQSPMHQRDFKQKTACSRRRQHPCRSDGAVYGNDP